MDPIRLQAEFETLRATALAIARRADELGAQASLMSVQQLEPAQPYFVVGLTVLVLAIFVGYYVVWRVTPALHSPLMAVTNAISSVIIVGALIAAGPSGFDFSKFMGFLAVILASVNIFGGFLVTRRMLSMFRKRQR
jgi:H+-translocating NAD(P) transhydrogenase subunit alpha